MADSNEVAFALTTLPLPTITGGALTETVAAALAASAVPVPAGAGGTGVEVLALTAPASAAAPIPAVTGGALALAVCATSEVAAPLSTITGGATVTGVTATAASEALVPASITGGIGVTTVVECAAAASASPVPALSTPPNITAITPNSAAGDASVTITNLAGGNFIAGATVSFTKAGEATRHATSVVVVSGIKITCVINLIGAAPGAWNVTVTTAQGTFTSIGLFMVGAVSEIASFRNEINPIKCSLNSDVTLTVAGITVASAVIIGYTEGSTTYSRKDGNGNPFPRLTNRNFIVSSDATGVATRAAEAGARHVVTGILASSDISGSTVKLEDGVTTVLELVL